MSGHDTEVLNTLIATTIDSAYGFDEAAAHAKAPVLASEFRDCARERRQIVAELQAEVRRTGDTPVEDGTAKATIHRRWLDLKNAVTGSDAAVVQEVDNGETYLGTKYETALADRTLSEASRRAIESAFASVQRAQDRFVGLRPLVGDAPSGPLGNVSWSRLGIGLGAAAVAVAATRLIASRSRAADDTTLSLDTDENMRLISSRKVEGTSVVGRDGERLGTVDSFMVDKYSGRVAYAIMSYGGVMGVGGNLFPLPWDSLTYDVEADGYRLNIGKADLADAPRFEASAAPEFDAAYRRQILVFYRSARSRTGSTTDRTSDARTGSGAGSSETRSAAARSRRGSAMSRDDDRSGASASSAPGGVGERWQDAEPANRLAAGGSDNRAGDGPAGGFNAPGGQGGSFGAPGGTDKK